MKYKFICPIFRIEVWLCMGNKEKDEGYSASVGTVTKDSGDIDHITVWIEKPDNYNDMVHETIYLTKRIFEIVSIPFTAENDEIIAYYQNYWVRKFWNKMSKFVK